MKYMYNTIEVMILEITSVQIKFLKKGGFYAVKNENIKHKKVLPYLSIVQSMEGSYDIALGNEKAFQTGDGAFLSRRPILSKRSCIMSIKKAEKCLLVGCLLTLK